MNVYIILCCLLTFTIIVYIINYLKKINKRKRTNKALCKTKELPKKRTTINKQLIECKNKAGDTYWEVIMNNNHTGIHWNRYEDAKFCYDHIIDETKTRYMYECSKINPYIVLTLDKCFCHIIPVQEHFNSYSYSDLNSKYVFDLNKRKNQYIESRSLEEVYNNIIAKDNWETKVLFSSEEEQKIEEEIELTITNNDIKALQKIIKEYSDTVKLSQMIAKKLCENNKK